MAERWPVFLFGCTLGAEDLSVGILLDVEMERRDLSRHRSLSSKSAKLQLGLSTTTRPNDTKDAQDVEFELLDSNPRTFRAFEVKIKGADAKTKWEPKPSRQDFGLNSRKISVRSNHLT